MRSMLDIREAFFPDMVQVRHLHLDLTQNPQDMEEISSAIRPACCGVEHAPSSGTSASHYRTEVGVNSLFFQMIKLFCAS